MKPAKLPLHIAAAAVLFLWGCGNEPKGGPEAVSTAQAVTAGKGPSQEYRGDITAGKAIYEEYCHYCHGDKGYGDGPVGLAITPHPADFVHDTKRMSKSDAELMESITEGIQREIGGESMSMPRWKEILSEKERRDVLAYVRELERQGKAREAAGGK